MILLGEAAGRWLELASDRRPRGMIVTAFSGNTSTAQNPAYRRTLLFHSLVR